MPGSRFRRTAVPLGLMGAAASVCYPAPAVAVVKVVLWPKQESRRNAAHWQLNRHGLSFPGDGKAGVLSRTVEQRCRVLALCLRASGGRRHRCPLATATGYHQYCFIRGC